MSFFLFFQYAISLSKYVVRATTTTPPICLATETSSSAVLKWGREKATRPRLFLPLFLLFRRFLFLLRLHVRITVIGKQSLINGKVSDGTVKTILPRPIETSYDRFGTFRLFFATTFTARTGNVCVPVTIGQYNDFRGNLLFSLDSLEVANTGKVTDNARSVQQHRAQIRRFGKGGQIARQVRIAVQ
jgi:hypothetical protein